MTAMVNEIRSPNQFLKRFLWSSHDPVPTEDIEISVVSRGREIAPFVRKNAEGIMVGGHTEKFQTVAAPNIRIKKPFTPSELLFNRRPGTVIFSPGAGYQLSALRAHMARDMQGMADMVTNAEEYLCSMALQGSIAYSVADQEVITITFPRSAGNNITLSTFWDDATPANVKINNNFHTVKQILSELGLAPTDAIMGTEAAAAFRNLVAGGYLKTLDQRHVTQGDIDFTQQFSEDGVIYLGTFDGIRCWEYGRTATLNGVATNMIRPKYVEFISRSTNSQRVLYYGAIPDMKALKGQLFQGERFSKSWEVEDPSAMMALLHSRPLPVPRRPDATVSMKVVSG